VAVREDRAGRLVAQLDYAVRAGLVELEARMAPELLDTGRRDGLERNVDLARLQRLADDLRRAEHHVKDVGQRRVEVVGAACQVQLRAFAPIADRVRPAA